MKKAVLIIILIAIAIGTWYLFFKPKINKKKDWYVEITNEYINVRETPDQFGNELGKVYKGDEYLALDVNIENSKYVFYKIEYTKGKYGWVANYRGEGIDYLKDYNNPNDIFPPTLKIKSVPTYAKDIKSIKYDNIEYSDDKENPKLEHKVYHEVNSDEGKDQYWIKYTVTDKSGKTTSKVARIVFENNPKDSEVEDFSEMKK